MIDYEETFAPIAQLTSIKSLLAVAVGEKWGLYQMDLKNTFLNDDLREEVYVKPPPGHHAPDKIFRLHRVVYGLKQALRAWLAKFSSTVHCFVFCSYPYDNALFIRHTDKVYVLLLLYINDMISGDMISKESKT